MIDSIYFFRWSKWNEAVQDPSTNWYHLFISRHRLELQIQKELREISRLYYNNDLISSDAYKPIQKLLQDDSHVTTKETLTEYLITLLSNSRLVY